MTIEFLTPYGKISERMIDTVRNKVLALSHINKKISRAEVVFREELSFFHKDDKACEIRLNVYGDSLYVHTRTGSFEESARKAVKELLRLVRLQVKKQKELPDQMLSTVKA